MPVSANNTIEVMKMFARKTKRNYRIGIFTAVILCLCGLIAALAWPETPVESPDGMNPDYTPSMEINGSAGSGTGTLENLQTEDLPAADGTETGEEEDFLPENGITSSGNVSEKEENSMNQSGSSYYLVKKAGDAVTVFFCDASGNMVALETTEILYSMLGPEDQKLFDEGIRVSSQEELGILLQDFEG